MFKYVKFLFRGGFKILFTYPKINKYYKNKDKYTFENRYAFVRKIIKCFFDAFRVEINYKGVEKLNKDDNYLIVSNHQSVMDALALIYLCEKPMTFVCKIEAKKYPFVGKICGIIDVIFIDRDNIRDAVKVNRTSKEYLNKGLNVVIYPEGTRTRDDNFVAGEYKPGALKSAYETKKGIASVAVNGSYKLLSKKYKKDFNIDLEVLDLYNYDVYGGRTTSELAEEIRTKTNEWLNVIRKQKGKS